MTILDITIILALCYGAWGFFFMVLHPRGITYTTHAGYTTGYFLTVAAAVSFIFWEQVEKIIQPIALVPLSILAIFLLSVIAWHIYFPRYVQEPTAYLKQHPDRFYLEINWRRAISKSADIAAQQIIIVLLVLFLKDFGLSLLEITLWFFVLFALLHVPLVAHEWRRWPSFLFGGAVLAFSALFPFLILYASYGFVYTFILHWLFYILMAMIFWVWNSRRI